MLIYTGSTCRLCDGSAMRAVTSALADKAVRHVRASRSPEIRDLRPRLGNADRIAC
jgi:hypothetical protein